MDDCWLQNLNKIDRLGLAYCRLNCWEWDNIIGPKPEGFDNASRCWWKFILGKTEDEWFRWFVSRKTG